MRDTLPKKPKIKERDIINLDTSNHHGTHWVAYVKNKNYCEYFDSYGDLKPPLEGLEVIRYLKNCNIFYNYTKYQKYDTVNCGNLCLAFLKRYWNKT